ncbi:MAG TPA: hydroxysqualene dehydroxylase HpnE, partial [Bacteroidota bacterium]
LGGRTHSFVDEASGNIVDNGQHLMMGCYRETRSYLKTIGSEQLAPLQHALHIDFLDPLKGPASLQASSFPAPFHVLTGLMQLTNLSLSNRLRLLRVGRELLWSSKEKERLLDTMTVDGWLTSLGQSTENKSYLWDTIAIGSLNDHPNSVSALLFFRVLRAAFMGTREDSCLLIPRTGLSSLLVDPAVKYIADHKGEIRTNTRIQVMRTEDNRIESVRTMAGRHFEATSYVLAVPYFDLPSLLPDKFELTHLDHFTSTPIVSINLWFDRKVFDGEFSAVLNSDIQWIFNRSQICPSPNKSGNGTQHLSLVISGAAAYIDLEKDRIVEIALNDLRRVIPAVNAAKLVRSLVIKEKRATFSPKPGMETMRPDCRTKYGNLFLAGDWTNTGLPATIEGAVLSGRTAAKAALNS